MGQRVLFPVPAVSANGWPCLYTTENAQTFIGQKVLPSALHYPTQPFTRVSRSIACISETFCSPLNRCTWRGCKAACDVWKLLPELLSKASTCLWSPFPICLSYPLVLALNFLLAETIYLLPVSTRALQGPNQVSCYSNCIQNLTLKPTQRQKGRGGFIQIACNQQQWPGTGQLLLVLVTVL